MHSISCFENGSEISNLEICPNLAQNFLAVPEIKEHIAKLSILRHNFSGEYAVRWFLWAIYQ